MPCLGEVHAIMRDGHFVLKSGRHTSVYVNKDAIYPHTRLVDLVTEQMAKLSPRDVDVVVGPAVGGVILSTWIAHHLSRDVRVGHQVLSAYADKVEYGFALKRGYDRLVLGKEVLVVEDIVTTGDSLMKTIAAVRFRGGNVVGAVAMCNRGMITAEKLGVPMFSSLLDLPLVTFAEDDCHLCAHGVPVNVSVGHGAEYICRKAQQP